MMKTNENNLPEIQAKASVPEQPIAKTNGAGEGCAQEPQKARSPRKDAARFNAMRHGIFSQSPLEALARLGEDVKRLRRVGRRFRADLEPVGMLGAFWFDTFWSSYLRCVLAGKMEGISITTIDHPAGQQRCNTSVKDGQLPVLIRQDDGLIREALAPDLLGHLALVARYHRHFSREMYRALAMLLVLRSRGEAGLEECIGRMVGLENENC